jgi:hypothetical protein
MLWLGLPWLWLGLLRSGLLRLGLLRPGLLWLGLSGLRPLLLRFNCLTGLRPGRLRLRPVLLRLGYLSTARVCLRFSLDRLSRLL